MWKMQWNIIQNYHGSNSFLSQIIFSCSVIFDNFVVFGVDSTTNSVNFLVTLNTMMITTLTSTWNRVCNSSWMPSSNTGNLSETFVSLSWQFFGSPSVGDTWKLLSSDITSILNRHIINVTVSCLLIKNSSKDIYLSKPNLAKLDSYLWIHDLW